MIWLTIHTLSVSQDSLICKWPKTKSDWLKWNEEHMNSYGWDIRPQISGMARSGCLNNILKAPSLKIFASIFCHVAFDRLATSIHGLLQKREQKLIRPQVKDVRRSSLPVTQSRFPRVLIQGDLWIIILLESFLLVTLLKIFFIREDKLGPEIIHYTSNSRSR